MTDDRAEIAARFAEARKSAGLTQQAAADFLKVSKGLVGQWETGETLPGAQNLIKASDLYQRRPNWLMTGQGPAERVRENESTVLAINRVVEKFEALIGDIKKEWA